MDDAALKWIAGPHTGSSSKALWAVMMGQKGSGDHPHDADDLWRCLRLLEHVPEWKARIGEMRAVSPYWAALVDRWEELVAAMSKDSPDLSRPFRSHTTSKIMKDALRPVEDKDPRFIRLSDVASIRF